MYVFRQNRRYQPLATLAAAVRRLCGAGAEREARQELLLGATSLECAVADHWGAERDGRTLGHCAALRLSLAAARFYLGHPPEPPLTAALDELERFLPPGSTLVPVSQPEGFRFYGLLPDAYVAPARDLARLAGAGGVFVLGLRSIGSTLAAIVAGVLSALRLPYAWATVRPRGEPENRYYRSDPALEGELRRWPGWFAIVDEGPGLSGSSFGGAVAWLTGLGVAEQRIALMPSWDPPAERLSHTVVAARWAGWRKFPAAAPESAASAPETGTDLSAGRWRQALGVRGAIPVWPQRERLKVLTRDGRAILKFGGLGAYGSAAAARARLLAGAGFAPPAEYLGNGWLRMPRLAAQPLSRAALKGLGASWAEWAGRYFAFVRAHFALGPAQPPEDELQLMTATNLQRLLRREIRLPPPEGVPVLLDGKLQAHEWGLCAGRFVKFDALEHGDDHFFPGPADIAWDLAGLEFEFGSDLARAVRDEYARRSGDFAIAARLAWYRVAYAAFQAAYAEFARELVGPPDHAWFCAARDRYLAAVKPLLDAAA